MRTFNWNKLPVNKIWGKNNIWSMLLKKDETNPNKAKIDFQDMESLFCQQTAPPQRCILMIILSGVGDMCFCDSEKLLLSKALCSENQKDW